jgi:hypothetical protein
MFVGSATLLVIRVISRFVLTDARNKVCFSSTTSSSSSSSSSRGRIGQEQTRIEHKNPHHSLKFKWHQKLDSNSNSSCSSIVVDQNDSSKVVRVVVQ